MFRYRIFTGLFFVLGISQVSASMTSYSDTSLPRFFVEPLVVAHLEQRYVEKEQIVDNSVQSRSSKKKHYTHDPYAWGKQLERNASIVEQTEE